MEPVPSKASGATIWALLIGINEYVNLRNLNGCVNDVEAMQIFLQNQLNVPEAHIRVRTNEQATRAHLTGLQELSDRKPGHPTG